MKGRPEHTDKMKHHGTWHLQLSGSKVWFLRATSELQEYAAPSTLPEPARTHAVRCDAGDVLVVNTRLWWHSTKIPSLLQDGEAQHRLTLSYARDFVISAAATGAAASAREAASIARSSEEDPEDGEDDKGGTGMGDVNVDGMLATEAIKKGSVIMMADEMPKRRQQMCVQAPPNCLVKDLEDGRSALVAAKDIASGDLFLVLAFEEDENDPTLMNMKTFVV